MASPLLLFESVGVQRHPARHFLENHVKRPKVVRKGLR